LIQCNRSINVQCLEGRLKVSGAVWNLVAAILCTTAAAITAVAAIMAYLSDPNLINMLAGAAGVIGTAGGVAWIAAAVIGVREK
jgi:hypothetical protein